MVGSARGRRTGCWRFGLALGLLASVAASAPPAKDPPAEKAEAKPKKEAAAPKPSDKPPAKSEPAPKAAAKSEPKKEPAKPAPEKPTPAKSDTGDKSARPVGPGEGSGERRVEPPPEKPPAEPARAADKKPVESKAEATKAHQKGRPPKKPNSTLPAGTQRSAPNDAARRVVAGGATAEQVRRGSTDPELSALRDADRVLFPKPLSGARAGFDWDLPEPQTRGPEVVASGVPPDARLRPTRAASAGDAASEAEWLEHLTMPNLPVRLEARVVKYLEFYRDNARGRAIARVWAKKSGRYTPALKAELAKAGLPTDLVWLSLIESGHSSTIVSPAGAAGLWQFMPESGRLYGLTVDRWVDERLDPSRSTEAAIRYLSDLHRRFGNWELAMAAYNMGYGGLSRAIQKFNTNDFWELSRYEAGIPWETTLYVPKIFAIAIVMNNKKAFGIADVAPEPAESFDTVLVAPGTSFDQIALAAEIATKRVESLNPHILAARTPPVRPGEKTPSFRVRVPAGKGVATSQRMNQVWAADSKIESYLVRFGDTLETIARARGTNIATLRQINRVRDDEPLPAGTVLLVPKPGESTPTTDAEDEVVVVAPRNWSYPDRRRVFYRIRSGDTLGHVAQAFDVSRSELEAWNALDPSARLQPGMVLQVFVQKGSDLSSVRYLEEARARVLIAGTPDFIDYHEGQKGKKRLTVEAKDGDTLASIGRRYGMSVGWMERINRRSRSKKLRPGDKLVVYVTRATPDPLARANGDEREFEPLPAIEAPHPEALPGGQDAASAPTALEPASKSPGG
jgi:membrane-bound lytic murein transglycosylase D